MAMTVGSWIFVVIVALVLLFSIISNGLVIYCVTKLPKLRSVTNVLICNLAVSDILLAGFVMPQKLHDLSHEEDFFEGDILCKTVNFCPVFLITSSIYTLVCVSFERRRAIMQRDEPQFTYAGLYKIIPALWLFGILVSIPTLVEYAVNTITIEVGHNSTKTQLSCGSQHVSDLYSITNAIFVVMISYILPMICMFKNYIDVAVFLNGKRKEMQVCNTGNRERIDRYKSRTKIVKLLVLVAVIFAVSWLPYFITLLYAKITHKDASEDASGWVNMLIITLASFSTAYNVMLYVIYNPSFSRAFKNILRCGTSSVTPTEHTNPQTRTEYIIQHEEPDGDEPNQNGHASEAKF